MITVRAPATSANLGPGFDALGLALGLYDEVSAQLVDAATTVEVAGEGAGELPEGEGHLVIQAIRATFEELGARPGGIALRCHNRIPQARGLGSSSAAIVAGVLLASELTGAGLHKADQLRIASRLEGHPDNVAPCLLGGFTIAWLGEHGAEAVSLAPSEAVQPTVFVPLTRGLTAQARAALPSSVPHADAAFTAGRAALLVHALTVDPLLLFAATEDRLHQSYRASGMPETAELVRRLRGAGVPAVVSGAGPSVLAFSPPPPDFSPGPGWLGHTLAAQSGGAGLITGNIWARSDHVE